MTASQSGLFTFQAFTSAGALGAGMRLYFYTQGTTTKKDVYTTPAASTAHTLTDDGAGGEYLALDARGEAPAPIYLTTGAYDILLKTAAGATVWTRRADPIADVAYVNVKTYGAIGDGTTNDAAAINLALAASTCVVFPPGSYKIASTITVSLADSTLIGYGNAEIITNGTNGITVAADNVRITGLEFRSLQTSSTTPDVFIYAHDVSGLTLDNCEIGRGLISCRSTASTTESNLSIHHNLFTGDYTGRSGTDIGNVIDVRGWTNVDICDNKFTCIEWYRIAKISAATGDTIPYDTGRCKRVVVTGNQLNVSASAGQQCIDFFASAEETIVSNNAFTCAGSFANIVNYKPGDVAASGPYVNNIVVTNNVFKLASGVSSAIFVSGTWGLAWHAVNNKCLISGNMIEEAGTTTTAAITVKGVNFATIANNVREAPALTYSRFMSIANNQSTIITGNHCSYGFIDVIGTGSTPAGDSYGNQGQSLLISHNTIDDMDAAGAISFEACSAFEDVSILNNHLRNQTNTGTINGCVSFVTTTLTRLNMSNNTANFATASKNAPYVGGLTATTRTEVANNWNATTSTWDPGSLADGVGETSAAVTLAGAAFGDIVRVAAPYDLQGITCNAYVSAANTVKARLQNETTGTIDLASGTWRWSLEKA